MPGGVLVWDMARYACPVTGCDYQCSDVDTLAGHIGGQAGSDEAHADYGEIRRFELMDCEIESKGSMNR